MSTTTDTHVPQGWPALFAALPQTEQTATVYLSLVSPEKIAASQWHICEAMRLLRRLSQSINARAIDDDFGQPNDADIAREELEMALDALGGGEA